MKSEADSDRVFHRRYVWVILTFLIAMLLISVFAHLYTGTSSFGFPTGPVAGDLWASRIFRILLAILVGVGLSTSGVNLQALLRNPLAEPYLLGLSTGAGVGVMVHGILDYYFGLGQISSQFGAMLGAGLSMWVVYLFSRRSGMLDPLSLLLTGVVLSTVNGSIILFLNYLTGPGGIRDNLAQWMMGYLNESMVSDVELSVAGILIAGCLLVSVYYSRAIDIASLSEVEAHSLGVNLRRLRFVLFFNSSVLAGCAVFLSGPLAFVGLICPHIARLLFGPSHGMLLIGSAIIGGGLVVWADVVSAVLHHLFGIGLMPIGIFTAMGGGPMFIYLLRRRAVNGVMT